MMIEFNLENIKKIPESSGIYFLYSYNKHLLYVGQSIDIRARLYQHLTNNSSYKECVCDCQKDMLPVSMFFKFVETNENLRGVEFVLIKILEPLYQTSYSHAIECRNNEEIIAEDMLEKMK